MQKGSKKGQKVDQRPLIYAKNDPEPVFRTDSDFWIRGLFFAKRGSFLAKKRLLDTTEGFFEAKRGYFFANQTTFGYYGGLFFEAKRGQKTTF